MEEGTEPVWEEGKLVEGEAGDGLPHGDPPLQDEGSQQARGHPTISEGDEQGQPARRPESHCPDPEFERHETTPVKDAPRWVGLGEAR
jgi:hypothetical protein